MQRSTPFCIKLLTIHTHQNCQSQGRWNKILTGGRGTSPPVVATQSQDGLQFAVLGLCFQFRIYASMFMINTSGVHEYSNN